MRLVREAHFQGATVTKTPKTLGFAAILLLCGLFAGVGLGLWIGLVGIPMQLANRGMTELESKAQEDLIVLTANTYALDRDLERAKERLAQLKDRKSASAQRPSPKRTPRRTILPPPGWRCSQRRWGRTAPKSQRSPARRRRRQRQRLQLPARPRLHAQPP